MEIAGANEDAELFRRSSFFWPAPLTLREEARTSVEPDEWAAIPDAALFVLEHQGYVRLWLHTSDPAAPVFMSREGREVKPIASNFRGWLPKAARDVGVRR